MKKNNNMCLYVHLHMRGNTWHTLQYSPPSEEASDKDTDSKKNNENKEEINVTKMIT